MAREAVMQPTPAWVPRGFPATADVHSTAGQIGWLVAATLVATLPHAGALPAWIFVGLGAACVWRLGCALRHWPMPSRLVRGLLTLGVALGVAARYRGISGIEAGSALLILMLALKLLETRNARDRSLVVLIAWFVLFAVFLRAQSLASVPQLVASLVVGLVALLGGTRAAAPLGTTTNLLAAGRLLGQAVPLALVLFLLFPRLPGPFWSLPAPGAGQGSRSGLTDEISPGDITALALSDEVAFRVRFDGPAPAPPQMYWRGPVLDLFDGRRWRAPRTGGEDPPPPRADRTRQYAYEVTLEPHHQRWALPLDAPLDSDLGPGRISAARELTTTGPVDRRIVYRARSAVTGAFRTDRPPAAITTALPAKTNPQTRVFARRNRAAAGSDALYLQRLLRMFREQEFRYTLQPPSLGLNPVDDFLFRTRAGFCEHYASAFAVLARAAGLPARVVAGYQGGEHNPLADYWIIRQSDAHAWVEVWLDGQWVRFDPTAAVAPQRIELGLGGAFPGRGTADLPLLGGAGFVSRLVLGWDAINATWDRWVLAFGPDQQMDLMRELGFRRPALRDLALVCALTFGLLLLAFTALALRRPRAPAEPVERSWQRLCVRAASAFRPRHPSEGPAEYAAALAAARPDLGPAVQAITGEYLRLRYEHAPTPAEITRFRRLTADLRLPRRAAAPG